jgi:hypothetical protein
MANARAKLDGREIELGDSIATCGRSTDNTIAFPEDSNVSRYHAEIEKRPDGYWLIDLNSSNGTEVNGERLFGERPLSNGDRIVLGGTSSFEFTTAEKAAEKVETQAASPQASADLGVSGGIPQANIAAPAEEIPAVGAGGIATEAAAVSGGSKNLLLVAGIICGVALLCVAGGAAAFYFGGRSKCDAKASITKPEAGDTIANPTEVEVEAENTGCVAKAVFTIDGAEIASADSEPYTTTLDPSQFPDLADGLDHSLQIVLLDDKGQQIGQPTPVMLAFETRAVEKPEATPEVTKSNGQQTQGSSKPSAVTLLDTQQMSEALIKQFRGGLKYDLSNKQFLQEVQKRAGEYAVEGFFDRASVYRDAINVAYVREHNLDPPLGFILAMSRSKFNPTKQGDNEGLWQMSGAFVTANGYNGVCGTETLSDQSQNCAAKASALYMKALVYDVFDGDPVYSAAAFGKSPQEAAAWKATLPADRSDVWNVTKTAPEREQLVRFFAAGIVALNPQKFGLKKDRSIEELYRVAM